MTNHAAYVARQLLIDRPGPVVGKRRHRQVDDLLQCVRRRVAARRWKALAREYAEQKGYLRLFEEVGANLIDPSCGACIKAGPGVSTDTEQVTISAINRNYPGRSGPGQVYLASPLVVAASAIAGRIVGPDEI